MDAKVVFGWAFLVLMASVARAEEPPAATAEAVRAVCEKAMPDLLQGDPKGWEILRGSIYPDLTTTTFDTWAFQFAQEHARFQDFFNDPLDWKYLGEKKIGSVFRQYFFVCRYARAIRIWYFNAFELNERWFLSAVQYDSNEGRLLQALPNDPPGVNPTCVAVCEPLVEAIAHGKPQAAEQLKQLLLQKDTASTTFGQTVLQKGVAEMANYGRLLKCERVYVHELDGWLAECCYAVEWERALRIVHLRLYRPANEWQLLRWQIDGEYEPLLTKTELELNSAALPRQAARPALRAGR